MSKMSRKVYIAAFILVFAGAAALITASIGPANPASTEKKQVSKSKTIKTLNPKIAAFLKFLDKARSPEEVASAFKKAKFTQKESEQLNLELKKPPYSAKINRFKQMADTKSSTKYLNFSGKSVRQILSQKNQALRQAKNQRQARKKGQTDNKLRRLRSKLAPMSTIGRPSRSFRATPAPMREFRASQAAPGGGTRARITSVNPFAVEVGHDITIRGTNFGNEEGEVTLLINEELIYCDVDSWRNNRIVAVIPAELQPDTECHGTNVVGEFTDRAGHGLRGDNFSWEKNVQLWVKLYGGETGPIVGIAIRLDTALFTPEITAISPTEIEPGDDVLIEGRNFMRQTRDRIPDRYLQFEFGRGVRLEYSFMEWTDSYIRVRISETISGIRQLDGGLVRVKNCLNMETTRGGISFIPAQELQTLGPETGSARCWPAWPCLFGSTNHRTLFDFELRNGWVVEASQLREDQIGNGGAYYDVEPTPGRTNARTVVVVWCDGFSRGSFSASLIIIGPRGVDYR